MMGREANLSEQFAQAFGGPPSVMVRSPGRVNLIGEHTDYNDGWVFPAALDLGTDVVARGRDDGVLRVVAPRMNDADEVPIGDLRPREGPVWTRYVRGVAALLRETGCALPGADVLIESDLPIGAGLSSSAAQLLTRRNCIARGTSLPKMGVCWKALLRCNRTMSLASDR